MADDDIVPRLRLWAEGVQNQKAVVMAVAITEAAEEIKRLRAERDEARRQICEMLHEEGNGRTPEEWAERKGWDCFWEPFNEDTDD